MQNAGIWIKRELGEYGPASFFNMLCTVYGLLGGCQAIRKHRASRMDYGYGHAHIRPFFGWAGWLTNLAYLELTPKKM